MANPGYMQPQMGQMGQPQPAVPPPAAVVRRGTSKAVPVVVSAGLAVGVFCGLLFGVGVDKDGTAAASTKSDDKDTKTDDKKTDNTDGKAETKTDGKAETKPETKTDGGKAETKPETKDGSAAVASSGSGSDAKDPKAGSGSGSAVAAVGSGSDAKAGSGSAATVAKTAKLTIDIDPASIAKTAKITVEGQVLTAATLVAEVPLPAAGKKSEVLVTVQASGYQDKTQKVEVTGDTLVKVSLAKVVKSTPDGGGTTPTRPTNPTNPTRPTNPTNPGKGSGKKPGLIDI